MSEDEEKFYKIPRYSRKGFTRAELRRKVTAFYGSWAAEVCEILDDNYLIVSFLTSPQIIDKMGKIESIVTIIMELNGGKQLTNAQFSKLFDIQRALNQFYGWVCTDAVWLNSYRLNGGVEVQCSK